MGVNGKAIQGLNEQVNDAVDEIRDILKVVNFDFKKEATFLLHMNEIEYIIKAIKKDVKKALENMDIEELKEALK